MSQSRICDWGVVNMLNKQRNSVDCYETPITCFFQVFFYTQKKGDKMQSNAKLFLILIYILPLVYPIHAHAGTPYDVWLLPTDAKCMAKRTKGAGRNYAHYCGRNQSGDCANVNITSRSNVNYFENGQSSNGYWCCGGSPSKNGKWVKGSSWEQTRTQTISLSGGGTCTFTQKKTICEDWPDPNTDENRCTKVECPDEGDIFQNGKCMKPCASGQVFKNANSTECIDEDKCKPNGKHGIFVPKDGNAPYCKECKSDELYDTNENDCISLSSYKKYSIQDMKKCWRCDSDDNYLKCLKGETPAKNCSEGHSTNESNN